VKFDPAFFDENFYAGLKGAVRNRDSADHYEFALRAWKIFGEQGYHWLDVGCGLGFVVRHLQNLREKAEGCDISEYAVKNAVTHDIWKRNLLDFWQYGGIWDIVICNRTLEYLPEDKIQGALWNIKCIFFVALILVVIPTDHINPAIPLLGSDAIGLSQGRLTMKPKSWWEKQFEEQGLFYDTLLTRAFKMHKPDWDGIYIFRQLNNELQDRDLMLMNADPELDPRYKIKKEFAYAYGLNNLKRNELTKRELRSIEEFRKQFQPPPPPPPKPK